jgi:RNA polymerase sigma-70 factor (ECF subfamily)
MEETALMRIVVAERARVLAFIRSLVRERDLAEDILQDICVLAIQKRAAIQDESHLKKWLRTAARMEAMNLLRSRKRRGTPLDDRFLESLESAWDQDVAEDLASEFSALRDCVAALAPGARELIQKRYIDGVGYPELARALNRSVNGLYVTFCRIHVALADCVTKRLGNASD